MWGNLLVLSICLISTSCVLLCNMCCSCVRQQGRESLNHIFCALNFNQNCLSCKFYLSWMFFLPTLFLGQRIMTIQLEGVQYYISRMNPYSPELNYYLAYQYCRSLGLQLASFDTKEKYESMANYLTNAKFNNFDFWTSGNRLGTGMYLWMSTGLPFNSTFQFFENEHDSNGLVHDPLDQNGNTSPQRTARDDNRK